MTFYVACGNIVNMSNHETISTSTIDRIDNGIDAFFNETLPQDQESKEKRERRIKRPARIAGKLALVGAIAIGGVKGCEMTGDAIDHKIDQQNQMEQLYIQGPQDAEPYEGEEFVELDQ